MVQVKKKKKNSHTKTGVENSDQIELYPFNIPRGGNHN